MLDRSCLRGLRPLASAHIAYMRRNRTARMSETDRGLADIGWPDLICVPSGEGSRSSPSCCATIAGRQGQSEDERVLPVRRRWSALKAVAESIIPTTGGGW